MHITQKGQVTIPLEIRQQFGFLPHTEIEFIIKNNQVVLQKSTQNKRDVIKKQLESIRGSSKLKMSTDQLMKLLRG